MSAGIGNAFGASWSASTARRPDAPRLSEMLPSLLSVNMAGSHQRCLEMNNKACKESAEGGHTLALNLDLFFFFCFGETATFEQAPLGSLLSWHKPLRGLLNHDFHSVLLPGCITPLSAPLH